MLRKLLMIYKKKLISGDLSVPEGLKRESFIDD